METKVCEESAAPWRTPLHAARPTAELLDQLKTRRFHMAVVNAEGKAIGICTMEDLLEELFGPISDNQNSVVLQRRGTAMTDLSRYAFIIVLLCFLFEAFFAAAELSIISSNALELEALNQSGDKCTTRLVVQVTT